MSTAGWVFCVVCLSPIWGSLVWHVWSYSLKPRTIPKDRIDKMARSLIAAHGYDAAEMAFIEEDAAWRHGKVFEQGLWRQVRRRIQKIQNSSLMSAISDPCTLKGADDHFNEALAPPDIWTEVTHTR